MNELNPNIHKEESKICPNCKLYNPISTIVCDCGYNFEPGNNEKLILKDLRPKRKYGWGWYLLLGFLYIGINNTYKNNEDVKNIGTLISVLVALPVYFLFRNKYFKNIKNDNSRSFVAGIIAYILAVVTVIFISQFITPHVKSDLLKKINEENDKIKSYSQSFNNKYQILIKDLIKNPTSKKDIQNNIPITEKLIILFQNKDSIVINTFQNIQSAIDSSCKILPSLKNELGYSISDYSKIISKAKELSKANNNMLNSLLKYYKAALNEDKYANVLWQSYESNQSQVETIQKDYVALYQNLFGVKVNIPSN